MERAFFWYRGELGSRAEVITLFGVDVTGLCAIGLREETL